jgi:hypothetical protein
MDIGGRFSQRDWTIRTVIGESLGPRSDTSKSYSRLDYFLFMFPPDQLSTMVTLTSERLLETGKAAITTGELLKFFGVLLLITRFEFSARASLWSNTAPSKYQPAPSFGKTGMSRNRFDSIMSSIRFSRQPAVRPEHMSTEAYRWLLVDGFVNNFNDYREANFSPSDLICADESMSRWYGQGGYWINHGLPQYIAIDRKPEFGCEIQNSACGRSGIMMRLKLVKTMEEQHAHAAPGDEGLLHGTAVLKSLVLPWAQTDRIVCADSYFASVGTLQELKRIGLRFIGVVKTGRQYTRHRWRQVSEEPNAAPERVTLEIPQPEAAELYYDACGMIDRHNRCRQDDLMLERKLGTLDWSMRVNTSLLGMCIVDSWYAYSQCTATQERQKDFYSFLAEELIDNCHDSARRRNRGPDVEVRSPSSLISNNGLPRCGSGPHVTPTKRKRFHKGELTKNLYQGGCKVCKLKTTYICSVCKDQGDDENFEKHVYICANRKGRSCFPDHMASSHEL